MEVVGICLNKLLFNDGIDIMGPHKHLLFVLLFVLTSLASARTDSALQSPIQKADKNDFLNMSLEELMEVKVTTASRQPQRTNFTSAPVSVITQEDIHYSGATNIYEILQYAPGIDAIQIDRNTYALGIRGLHEGFSDRTLTLINGRPADNIVFGGSEFLRMPVLIHDIERIEVVRGPGGAAWGANAFNGVINIITKQPKDTLGVRGYTQWNHFGDNTHQLSMGDQHNALTWRMSLGLEKQDSSSAALHNE